MLTYAIWLRSCHNRVENLYNLLIYTYERMLKKKSRRMRQKIVISFRHSAVVLCYLEKKREEEDCPFIAIGIAFTEHSTH